MKKIPLPPWEELAYMLRSRYDDRHANENLLPLIRTHLYTGDAEKTGVEIGDALVNAVRQYIHANTDEASQKRRAMGVAMSYWIASYIGAIAALVDDDDVSRAVAQRCNARRHELVT